jgi:PEP-CTERM motif-containing protein
MNRFMSLAAIVLVVLAIASTAQADIIFESAILGPTGFTVPVPSITDGQFLGSRFSVGSTVKVRSVGGHLEGFSGSLLFAAIVSLSSPTALPSGSPFDMTTVATVVFRPPFPSDDILVPLSVKLNPGNYGLIFGLGQFGAVGGGGGMPENNIDIHGSAPYFAWVAGSAWEDASALEGFLHDLRFVVTGNVVPEPGSITLFGLGSLCFCGFCRPSWIGK